MFLSSLFVVLGLSIAQPIPSVPVETTTLVTATRHTFTHQENNYILDLNDDDQIVAFYINNDLQNSHLNALFEYNAKSENDLLNLFVSKRKRTISGRDRSGGRHPRSRKKQTNSRQSVVYPRYFSNNNRCFRKDRIYHPERLEQRRRRNPRPLYTYRNTEIDYLSPHCPENRAKILRFQQYPELFFTAEDGFTALDNTGKNFVQEGGGNKHGYMTDEYLRNGSGLLDAKMRDLLIPYGILATVSRSELANIAKNADNDLRSFLSEHNDIKLDESALLSGLRARFNEVDFEGLLSFAEIATKVTASATLAAGLSTPGSPTFGVATGVAAASSAATMGALLLAGGAAIAKMILNLYDYFFAEGTSDEIAEEISEGILFGFVYKLSSSALSAINNGNGQKLMEPSPYGQGGILSHTYLGGNQESYLLAVAVSSRFW